MDSEDNLFNEDITGELSDRHKLFCMEYLNCGFNGAEAARRAGYAEDSAKVTASKLLTNANLVQHIEHLKKNLAETVGISQAMIVNEMRKIAFSSVKNILTEKGGLKHVSEISDSDAASIAGIDTFENYDSEGMPIGETRKIKMYSKPDALIAIHKMLGYDLPVKTETEITGGEIKLNFVPDKEID